MAVDIDRRVVGEGALWTLAVALPAVLLAPPALLVGFALGGFVAGRRRADTPLMHAAAVAAAAFAALVVIGLVRRAVGDGEVTESYVVRLLLLVQICVSTAMLGGWWAARRAAANKA